MFKRSDLGRSIRIIDPNGANLSRKINYRIVDIQSYNKVYLDKYPGIWEAIEGSFIFTDLEDVNIGDTIIIQSNTTTLNAGDERKVTGFMCDDKTKLIVDNILPGSWINLSKVIKKKDLSKIRLKTIFELIKDYGFTFPATLDCPKCMLENLGRNLSELKVIQEGDVFLMLEPKKFYIARSLMTDTERERDNIEVFIGEKARDKQNAFVKDNIWKEPQGLNFISNFGKEQLNTLALYNILYRLISGENLLTHLGISFNLNDLVLHVNEKSNNEKNHILPF